MNKPEIVFTFPIALGGVSSFNFNIINNSALLKEFKSKVILLRERGENRPAFSEKFIVDEAIVFESSHKENQYYVQKRLNKLLGNTAGAIVTDNGLTMEAARRFNNPKTVFSLLHDEYYVKQQIRLGAIADVAIAHSPFFSDSLKAHNTFFTNKNTFYIPYGVKQLDNFPSKMSNTLKLVFLGRLEESKNPLLLFEINKLLLQKNIKVEWTIIGKGSLKKDLENQWQNERITILEPSTTDAVYNILQQQDIFIFPTTFEGTPVAILEAMACGVVTVVNDLPGGIQDVVTEDIGFRINDNKIEAYVEAISLLNSNREKLKLMQKNNYETAQEKFNILNNADNYISYYKNYENFISYNKIAPKKLQKLDLKIVPSFVTNFIRKNKN